MATVLVTGGNKGIGLQLCRQLVNRGDEVIATCRQAGPDLSALDLRVIDGVDVSDGTSVQNLQSAIAGQKLDVLINNAGIMAVERTLTEDGFESQLGVNHLAHFALTGLLVDRLLENDAPRVVNVSSHAHRSGAIQFDDLAAEQGYKRFGAYAQSKLANLLFTMELQRRFRRVERRDALSTAAHPGFSSTNLGTGIEGGLWGRAARFAEQVAPSVGQSSLDGAVPTLRAATDPDAVGGDYFGPAKLGEMRGPAVKVKARPKAYDVHDARGLWEASVELTGVTFDSLIPEHDQ